MTCGTAGRPAKPDQSVPPGELLRQLQRTLQFLQYSELSTFDGEALMKACANIGMYKSIELQNDTSEFFQRLLEKLESEVFVPKHPKPCKIIDPRLPPKSAFGFCRRCGEIFESGILIQKLSQPTA